MGHLQGVVKLHASAKAVCALLEGAGSFRLLFTTLMSCWSTPGGAWVGQGRVATDRQKHDGKVFPA